MNGQRALEILNTFAKGPLAFTAKEIDELLAAGLAIEADPRDAATLAWLHPLVAELSPTGIDDPETAPLLQARLADLDERLKSDWHRFATSDEALAKEELERRNLKRVLGVLGDAHDLPRLVKAAVEARTLAATGTKYLACKPLGDELYAITHRGITVARALAMRFDRYRDHPLATFVKAFDKAETKMQAFGGEIATLSNNIGYVKKNPHQIVIGLAKTGQPATEALGVYHQAKKQTGAADVAVTLARNASAFGGTAQAQERLERAIKLLQHAGFPWIPATFGAAKTLLAFEPLESGVARFDRLTQLLGNGPRSEVTIKLAARLMPADGSPEEVVRRVGLASAALGHSDRSRAVPIAAMVRTDDAVAPLVIRLQAVELALAQLDIVADAIECVACPGTPSEVAATVHALMLSVAKQHGRAPTRGDAAIAAAFAKRFAY